MKQTQRLIDRLYRGFNRDPEPFLALRISYDGGLKWEVADQVLTLTASGGIGISHEIDLRGKTIAALVLEVSALPGYSVLYSAGPQYSGLAAAVLLDATGDQAVSNGDHLFGYTSLVWAYEDCMSVELVEAARQIDNMLLQMSPTTAETAWLDVWGGYFGIPRRTGEFDRPYGSRMIVEVLRPRCNNVAMEVALSEALGQPATVTDAVHTVGGTNFYNAVYTHDGSIIYSGIVGSSSQYGLFDVGYAYDILSGDKPAVYVDAMLALVERLRAGGTQLRSLILTGSQLADAGPPAAGDVILISAASIGLDDSGPTPTSDAMAFSHITLGMVDGLAPRPVDPCIPFSLTWTTKYNGLRRHNGAVPYASGIGPVLEEVCDLVVPPPPFTLSAIPIAAAYIACGSGTIVAKTAASVSPVTVYVTNDVGATWIPVVLPATYPPIATDAEYDGLFYGNGHFLAVRASGDNVAASTNGTALAWNAYEGPYEPMTDGVYAGDRWVFIGSSQYACISTDNGQTWSLSDVLPNSGDWTSIAYDAITDVLIAFQAGSPIAAKSTDRGATWSAISIPF